MTNITINGRTITIEQLAAAMARLHSTARFDELKTEYRNEIVENANRLASRAYSVAGYDADLALERQTAPLGVNSRTE